MANRYWTDRENDLIVKDYFAMLSKELAWPPRNYSKTSHRRALVLKLQGRSESSVEFKHRNISAVLQGIGEAWILGYKPAFNFQDSLAKAVFRWLNENHEWTTDVALTRSEAAEDDALEIPIGPAPTFSNQPSPPELEQMQRLAQRFDVASRDERNRLLGREGERRVFEHEQFRLKRAGYGKLADEVCWVSRDEGDGMGYDIRSYAPDGRRRLIEVKTTNGWERTPFHITRNELEVSREHPSEWCLFRLWNFSRKPTAFEIHPPLERHVSLMPTSYMARFENRHAA